MKKHITVLALTLAAGCAVTFSGCGGTSILNTASLSSNWYALTSYKNIQPTFTGEENAERATYTVTHEQGALANSTYSVQFAKSGVYETLFYATDFDYNAFGNEEYAKSYGEAYGNKTVPAYYYKTTFDMPEMTFTCKGASTEKLHESAVTECYFLPVKDRLRPLYSKISVVSHSPANSTVSSIENIYRTIDRTYECFYEYSGGDKLNTVKTKLTFGASDYQTSSEEQWIVYDKLGEAAHVFFDNNAIDIAVRSMGLNANLSQAISLYSPNSGVQNYSVAGSTAALGEDEHKSITKVLQDNGLFTPTDEKPLIDTAAASVSYIGELTGVSQTYWYAAVTNPKNNTARATMLKISAPLSYGLGTLNYVLTELK